MVFKKNNFLTAKVVCGKGDDEKKAALDLNSKLRALGPNWVLASVEVLAFPDPKGGLPILMTGLVRLVVGESRIQFWPISEIGICPKRLPRITRACKAITNGTDVENLLVCTPAKLRCVRYVTDGDVKEVIRALGEHGLDLPQY